VRALAKFKGWQLDDAMPDRILNLMKEELRAGRTMTIMLRHGPGMSGIEIVCRGGADIVHSLPEGCGLVTVCRSDGFYIQEYVPLRAEKEKKVEIDQVMDEDASPLSSGDSDELEESKRKAKEFCRQFQELFLERGNALMERTLWFDSSLPGSVADPQ
ncbi:MAG: hypothetical protein PHQ27_11305, partial [Victivallales bacterium]|nr:hypothetical protein [Victivallales bacterium]